MADGAHIPLELDEFETQNCNNVHSPRNVRGETPCWAVEGSSGHQSTSLGLPRINTRLAQNNDYNIITTSPVVPNRNKNYVNYLDNMVGAYGT
jgi:hypothetical protein